MQVKVVFKSDGCEIDDKCLWMILKLGSYKVITYQHIHRLLKFSTLRLPLNSHIVFDINFREKKLKIAQQKNPSQYFCIKINLFFQQPSKSIAKKIKLSFTKIVYQDFSIKKKKTKKFEFFSLFLQKLISIFISLLRVKLI